MKRNEFDNRIENDLFPEMPASFGRKLAETMETEGVKIKKRPTAAGIFAGAVSVVAAAAVLMIVLVGALSGGKSGKTDAAARSEDAATTPMTTEDGHEMAEPTPGAGEWMGDTKVIVLGTGFEFANAEKFQALYTGILSFLRERGESEPEELWLCAIKSRYVKEDTGKREDGYISGYYVLAQHSFGVGDGPELYCFSDDFEVLWATEGSSPGPNHAMNPEKDSNAAAYQHHLLYGTEPMIAEPGIPHVKRGTVVGLEPGTDIEFSMAASITDVQNRLAAADSAYPGAAREYFLLSVPAGSWDYAMQAHTLRFETEEGPVDVDMETELPLVQTVLGQQPSLNVENTEHLGVEYWLNQNQPLILDLTDDWYGSEIVQSYAEAVRRALRTGGERIHAGGIWICAVGYDGENEDGTPPDNAYVLALNAGDGDPSPELFYYQDGQILWRTIGADSERINLVYHDGNTIVFGRSPAYDNGPLAMTYGKLVLENGEDEVIPALPLGQVQERITYKPYYDSARECYLWKDVEAHEIKELIIAAESDGKIRQYTLDKVNVLSHQPVPAMALEIDNVVYPGNSTHLAHSLDENGVSADGEPLLETLKKMSFAEWVISLDVSKSWSVLTASDKVTVDGVDVYTDSFEQLANNAEISYINGLDPGTYFFCFRTTVQGPYSQTIAKRTFRTEFTVFQVTLE